MECRYNYYYSDKGKICSDIIGTTIIIYSDNITQLQNTDTNSYIHSDNSNSYSDLSNNSIDLNNIHNSKDSINGDYPMSPISTDRDFKTNSTVLDIIKADNSLINENNYIDYFNNIIKSENNSYNIFERIKNELISGKLDEIILNIIQKENKDIIIKDDNSKIIYQITSTYNQINNKYDNLSVLNFGESENLLKSYYNISRNASLLLLKMEIYEEGLLIPLIEYEVYNMETKEQLDLNVIKYMSIDISIPVNINENNLIKHNSSSEYYNDMCYSYTTEFNTDMTLNDRRKEYINNNLSLCENNCKYMDYNIDTKKVLCECFIKIKIPYVSEIVINKDRLLNNFKDLKNNLNVNIMKCYYVLFQINGIIKNIGFYFMNVIIMIMIILTILFIIRGFDKVKLQVNSIIEEIKNVRTNTNKNKSENKKIKKKNEKRVKKEEKIKPENKDKKFKIKTKIFTGKKKKSNKRIKKKNVIINQMITNGGTSSKTHTKLRLLPQNKKINENYYIIPNIIKDKNQTTVLSNNKFIYKLNDYEMNGLKYNKALINDKRTYFQYYCSLIKTKHIIVFTFYTTDDYNPKAIKLIIFLFSFSLYLTVNALFFNDSAIHTIYEDKGSFNFIYQIPQIIYSTLIISLINAIINYFGLIEKNILSLKEKTDSIKAKSKLLDNLVFKFIIFFFILYSFSLLFWYYLSCLCAVYKNSQIHFLKNTLISFGLSLIYPLGINLLPGIFRIASLKSKNRMCMYQISKFFQLI